MRDGLFDIFRKHGRDRPSSGEDSSSRRGVLPDSEADEEDGCSKVRTEMGDGTTEWDTTVRTKDELGAGTSSHNREFVPDPSDDAHALIAGLPIGARDKDPIASRLMLAISTDGETWEKTGLVIANHASVPCLAVEENEAGEETLYLFFVTARDTLTTYNPDDSVDALCVYDKTGKCTEKIRTTPLAVAYTTDLITWTYRFLDCAAAGFEYHELDAYDLDLEDYSANDPSVVRTIGVTPDEDGEPEDTPFHWMMYYTLHYGSETSSVSASAAILVAFAHHLYDFEWTTGNGGLPVLPPSEADYAAYVAAGKYPSDTTRSLKAEDPCAAPVGDSGYLLWAGGHTPGFNWYAGLQDGVNYDGFAEHQETCTSSVGEDAEYPILMNNFVDAPGTALDFNLIAATGGEKNRKIISIPYELTGFKSGTYATEDDTKGDFRCTTILEEDMSYEHNGIREAAVARFGGCWVMVYVTGIEAASAKPKD